MNELEMDKRKNKNEKSVGGFLEKWLSAYIRGGKLTEKALKSIKERIITSAIAFAVSYVFSQAYSYGGTYPFGLSLLSGCQKNALFVFAGVITGYLRNGGGIYVITSLLVLALRSVVGYVLEGKRDRLFTEPVFVRMAIGAAGGFVCGIYLIFDSGFKEAQLYEAFFLISVIPVCTYIFYTALNKAKSGIRDDGMSVIAYTVFLLGLKSFNIYGLSLSLICSVLLTFSTSLSTGSIKGALTGMLGGLCMGSIEHIVALGIGSFVCGTLKRRSEAVSVGAGCACIGAALFMGNQQIMTVALPSVILGGVCTLISSKLGFTNRISVFTFQGAMSEDRANASILISRREEEMTKRLNALSSAMTSLSAVFYALSNRLMTTGTYKARELCEEAFKKYCKKCAYSTKCWGREYDRTADVLNKLADAVCRHGSADSSYIRGEFLDSCPHVLEALSEVNLTHARLLESAARQNKTEVFALDYEAMAKLLEEASVENAGEYEIDERLTRRVRRAALNMGMTFNSIAVYGRRRKTVIAGGVELEKVRISSSEMNAAFNNACGIKLSPAEFKFDNGYVTMSASSKRVMTLESAKVTSKKQNEDVNGDTAITFENREDRYYALICDGMGSGEDASMTSSVTSIFLQKLLCAGNRKNTVLKMLNNFIRNKNLECFSTVDLLEVDMLSGEGSFIKSGAMASYVVRNGRLFKISSKSLPIGITRELLCEEIKFTLKDSDIIIMLSDGICQSCDDSSWLLSFLSEGLDTNAPIQDIAKQILKTAKEKNGRSDDMTVIALRAMSDK